MRSREDPHAKTWPGQSLMLFVAASALAAACAAKAPVVSAEAEHGRFSRYLVGGTIDDDEELTRLGVCVHADLNKRWQDWRCHVIKFSTVRAAPKADDSTSPD